MGRMAVSLLGSLGREMRSLVPICTFDRCPPEWGFWCLNLSTSMPDVEKGVEFECVAGIICDWSCVRRAGLHSDDEFVCHSVYRSASSFTVGFELSRGGDDELGF